MSRHDLQLTIDLYAAANRSDLDAIRPLLAHDLVVSQPEGLPWSGRYDGPDGFFEFHQKLFTYVDTTVHTDYVYDAGEVIVQVGNTVGTIRSNGAQFNASEVHVLRFRHGLLVSFQPFVDVPTMQLALAGQPASN